MRFYISLFILCAVLLSAASSAFASIYNAETVTLKNGMQIVVIPNHRAPVVTHMVWYKVGSADEPQGDGVSGEAHFLEHLMFKGTHRVPAGEFSKIIRKLGGEDNAFTSWDYTAYFQSIGKDYLPIIMAMEADRMINLSPPADEIPPEHQVIMEERKQTIDNDKRSLFWEQLRATLYNVSPYAIPIIGWKNEMPSISWVHAKNYYDRWYAPNNAILVVSGDVTMKELLPLAEKFYGILPPKKIPEHIRPQAQNFSAAQTLNFKDQSVQQPLWVRVKLAPSAVQDYESSLALTLLQEILSSGSSGVLYQEFVVKQKMAIDVSFSYEGDNRGQGSVWLYAVPAAGVSLKQLEAAIEKFLSNYIAKPILASEIEKAKTRLVDGALYARDSVAGPAMVIGQGLASGLTLNQIEGWAQAIKAIKNQDVNDIAKEFLNSQNSITGYMESVKESAP